MGESCECTPKLIVGVSLRPRYTTDEAREVDGRLWLAGLFFARLMRSGEPHQGRQPQLPKTSDRSTGRKDTEPRSANYYYLRM